MIKLTKTVAVAVAVVGLRVVVGEDVMAAT
jgi:hypothetical protein